MGEIRQEHEQVKAELVVKEAASREELEELRRELQKERLLRRESLNQLRYDFEEFVHGKIGKIIEDMKRGERRNDSSQQMHIDKLVEDVERLKENLLSISDAWTKLVTETLTRVSKDL